MDRRALIHVFVFFVSAFVFWIDRDYNLVDDMKTGDSNTGERGGGVWGNGYHISTVGAHGVDCPICTCYNDPKYLFAKLDDEMCKTIKCKGCKRKLLASVNLHGSFILTEIL